MLNPATEKLVINNFMASYTMLYAQHNFFLDDDVVSKVVFYKTGSSEKTAFFPVTEKLYTYFTIKELISNSAYTLNAAFYDQMASDVTLVNAKKGINLSDTLNFYTAKTPSFTGIEVIATSVDVGVSDPTVIFTLDGSGQTVVIQAQKVGSTDWVTVFDGAFSNKVSVIVPVGDYTFRVSGRIMLPDGVSLDVSPWYTYPTTVSVTYLTIPPTTPTGLTFKAAKIKDGVERYDIQVSWTWERLSGANSKEFILQYVTSEEFNRSGWTKAAVINTASAKTANITNFPYNKIYVFRVGVTAWGQNTVWSSTSSYKIDSSTIFDQSITSVSGCEIGYYGIKAFVLDAGTYKQSFLLDAATGAVSIGTLGSNGKAPFVFDPVNKILNIDGKVVTNDINAANFILTNTGTGSAPKLYSQEKPYYAAPNSGVFIGRNGNGAMQLDIGNSASYLRFDGSNVKVAGQVIIGTASGDLPLEEAVLGKNVVFIYQTNTVTPTTPTSSTYPPVGWSTTPTAAPCWLSQGQLDPFTGTLLAGNTWSIPTKLSGESGSVGKSSFKSVVFIRSSTTPSTPTGGSYSSPVPSGWSDGVPSGGLKLWSSTRIFTSDGSSPQQSTWTTPQALTDTSTMETRYSSVAVSPGDPTTNPSNWGVSASASTIWLAIRVAKNGVWGSWDISKVKGETGATTYTWIKYADSSTGTGISDSPTGKTYIGFAYNKSTPTESNTPSDYTWSLIKGTDGVPGPPGADGATTYTWIKYSDYPDGTDMYDVPTDTKYIGIARGTTTATESTSKTDYKWVPFKGDTAPQGVLESNGTTYTWIRFADSSTGTGISNDPEGKKYIGFAYNKPTITESNIPSDYTWTLIKGGNSVPGPPGAGGTATYTWVKYSDYPDGTGLYDVPAHTKYIGIAVNKTTATESTLKTDYKWSLFKGDTGSRGPGIYAYAIADFSAWADSYANTFFSLNFGTGPAKFDVLTQYNATDPTIAYTKMWSGSAWTTPALVVHGDLIVDGTVRAEALVADHAFLAKAGIDVIYDRTAALSATPESTYKMKLDLANGFLHIR